MSDCPQLRLVYFPVRARAEVSRMILAYGNIPYKDDTCEGLYGMTFQEAKKAGKLPFGSLPVLEIGGDGGTIIAQSGSIVRYLASLVKTPGFLPTDPADQACCDMIYELTQELTVIMPIVNMFKGETFQKK